MDLSKAQKQKSRQAAHPEEMKFLQVQEATNCPAVKGCVMKNSPLLCYNPLLFSGLHCYNSTLLSRSLMPKNTSAGFVSQSQSRKKSKNLFYWTACYGFDWEMQHPKMSYWLNCHPLNVCSWWQTKHAFECAEHICTALSTPRAWFFCRSSSLPSTCGTDAPQLPTPYRLQNTRKSSLTQFKFTSLWLVFLIM